MKSWYIVWGSLLLSALFSCKNDDKEAISPVELQSSSSEEVWMCQGTPWELGSSGEWEFVMTNLDGFKFYVDQVNTADVDDLRDLVEVFEENDIEISIELGGLVDWHSDKKDQSAEFSFQDEFAKVKKLIDPVSEGGAGGTISYLDLDGPIRRMLYPFDLEEDFHSIESATDELVEVMELWQSAIPDIHFMVLTNFPNWGWQGENAFVNFGFAPGSLGYGDYNTVLSMIIDKATLAGVNLKGVTIDNPYDYAMGDSLLTNQQQEIADIDWFERILALEEFVEAAGLESNVIFNHAQAGDATRGSNEEYFNESLNYIDDYLEKGGSPKRFIIQSWYHYPNIWLPESQDFTMTNLTLEAINKVKGED